MPNVFDVLNIVEELNSANVTVKQSRCVAVCHRRATCKRCKLACPVDCITISNNNRVRIDTKSCTGCGACASVCPTGAFSAELPADDDLLKACHGVADAAEKVCSIVCRPMLTVAKDHVDPQKVVAVSCLGRVDESLLLSLAADDVQEIRLVKHDCANCVHHKGADAAEAAVRATKTLLEALGSRMKLRLSTKFPGVVRVRQVNGFDPTKRGFFAGMKGDAWSMFAKGADLAAKRVLPQEEEKTGLQLTRMATSGSLPRYLPQRRELLLEALKKLATQEAAQGIDLDACLPDTLFDPPLWGRANVDLSKCSACRTCATFCPTGALVKLGKIQPKTQPKTKVGSQSTSEEDAPDFGVVNTPGLCVACGSCVDVCTSKAFNLEYGLKLSEVLEATQIPITMVSSARVAARTAARKAKDAERRAKTQKSVSKAP